MTTKLNTDQYELTVPPVTELSSGKDSKSNEIMHTEDSALDSVKFVEEGPGESIHGARSKWEDIDARSTFRLFWKGALVCFMAAFSSFTDGYQVGSSQDCEDVG